MTEPAWDFTAAETGIVERLKLRVGSTGGWARMIATRVDLGAVAEAMQVVPAVYVIYNGFAVESATEYDCQLVHRWFAVLAIGNDAGGPEAAPRNQEAGPRLFELLKALHGFTPAGCQTPLIPVTAPRPYYAAAKFAYFPLAFTTTSTHCAD